MTAPPPPARPIAPSPAPAAASAAAPSARSFIDDLRRIAAERTGYPPEMLDLDAGIEADLGIDSIKRVEILTALQKLGTPEQNNRFAGRLEQLTSARRLCAKSPTSVREHSGPLRLRLRPPLRTCTAPFPPAATSSPNCAPSPPSAPAIRPRCSTSTPALKPTWASTPSSASKS